jgi:hypothetical protein
VDYEIPMFKDGEVTQKRLSNEPFEAVKSQAELHVKTGIADRVEVRNEAGELVFQFPRVMRSAE